MQQRISPKRVRKYFSLLPVFFSFPFSLLLRRWLSISVIAFSNTLRAILCNISKSISSKISKVRPLIGILTLTSEKVIVIVSMGVAYLPFVKGFCLYIGKPTPFYFSLAIFPLLLIVFTKKESYYCDYSFFL